MTSKHTAIITVPNRTIKHGEYMAAYGACETHTSIFSTYVRLPKTAVVSYVYTNGNVEINIETRSRLSKTVMDEITRFIECGFILEANIDGVELVEKPAPVVVEDEHNYTLPTDEEREEQCQLAHQVMASMMGEEMATLFMEEEEEEQVAYPLHMPQPPDDLHPTHGPLPVWMYANEQEPYARSQQPMQQQREQASSFTHDEQEHIRYLARGLRTYANQVEYVLSAHGLSTLHTAELYRKIADRGDAVMEVIREVQALLRKAQQ